MSRVPSCVPLLLLLECRFERREGALAGLAGALVLEGRLDLLAAPAAGGLRELRDRHGRVALRKRRLCLRRRRSIGLLRRCLLLRLGLGGGLRALRAADRLDLDAREPAA